MRAAMPHNFGRNTSMKLLCTFGIGPRLGAAFAVILTLLVLVAMAGLRGVSEVNEDLRVIYEDRTKPIEQLGEINKLLLRNRILVMDMMAFPNEANIDKRDKELRANLEQVGKVWEVFSKSKMDEDGAREAQVFFSMRSDYVAKGLLPVRDAMRAGKPEVAARTYQEVLSPLAGKLADALGKLVAHEIDLGRREFEHGQAQARTLFWTVIGIAGSALIMGALMAWVITRSITRPLSEAVRITET